MHADDVISTATIIKFNRQNIIAETQQFKGEKRKTWNNKKAVLSQRWPRDAMSASHVSSQNFEPMWPIHQRHRRTDVEVGQTDDMRLQDRALHCSACAVKTIGDYN